MPAIDLSKLSQAEKDAPIRSLLPLVGQLEMALARIAALEAEPERPRKRRTTRRCRRRTATNLIGKETRQVAAPSLEKTTIQPG